MGAGVEKREREREIKRLRERDIYIYICMPLDRFAAYILGIFWTASSCSLQGNDLCLRRLGLVAILLVFFLGAGLCIA